MGGDGIYLNTGSNSVKDPMMLLLLLQQVTGMLACCMYKTKPTSNDIEEFSVLSRGNTQDQKIEQFMCRICMQAFKNMSRSDLILYWRVLMTFLIIYVMDIATYFHAIK